MESIESEKGKSPLGWRAAISTRFESAARACFGAGWVFLEPSDSARSWNPGDSIEVEWHCFHEIWIGGGAGVIIFPICMRQGNFNTRSMKRTTMIMMTRIFCVVGMLAAFSQSGAAESWWRVFGTVEEGDYVGGGHDDEDGKPDPALIEFLATEKFDEWATFEDEAVKLVLKNLGYAELDEWVVACLQAMQLEAPSKSDTASTFDDPVGERADAAAELIGFLAEKNHPQVAALAQSLFRTGEPAWVMAAIECADHVEPEFAQEIIRESMKQAMAQQSGQLLEKIFDQLPSLKLKNPAEIVALIDQLPKGEADGDWEKSKSTARETLGKMTAEPTP